MHDEDPGEVFREAMPDSPPETEFDIDRIVADGYRLRRRNRAVLGGATAAGVAAVAGAIALVVALTPGEAAPEAADDPTLAPTEESAESREIGEPSMSGYPWRDGFAHAVDPETDAWVRTPEAKEVSAEATDAFGDLLADAGLWDDPLNRPAAEDCDFLRDEDECHEERGGLAVEGHHRPGNYGQVWLRSYLGTESVELDSRLRDVFSFEVLLPGGWTPEPGPVTEQLFPQHLISDGPYYTDQAPDFDTTDLTDGRTLMVADHDCAYDLAVVYPNGTGLRVSWNEDCTGTAYDVSLSELTEAVLSMPEFEFDTSTLRPIGELVDVPTGWVHDPEESWEETDDARAGAEQTYDEALAALQEVQPGATLGTGTPRSLGSGGRGSTIRHSYAADGTLPYQYENRLDGVTEPVYFDLRYYLPGGWVPGYAEVGERGPYLSSCDEESECSSLQDDDGTVWVFQTTETDREPFDGAGWEAHTAYEYEVTMFSPDGWAVGVWASWDGELPLDDEAFADILRAVPAPTYDEDAAPTIPAG